MCLPLSLSRYYMYVYTYYIHYVRIYVCILLKPSLRPPFVGSFEKSSDLARPQLQRFPPPRCPPISGKKKSRGPPVSVRREFQTLATSRAREFALVASFTVRWRPPIVRFFWLLSFPFLPLSSFFPSRPKIVGRRTRVIGQGSKTWKGYRNSLFPPFLSSFLSFVAISRFSFFLSVLPLSFSSLLTALGEKKK